MIKSHIGKVAATDNGDYADNMSCYVAEQWLYAQSKHKRLPK